MHCKIGLLLVLLPALTALAQSPVKITSIERNGTNVQLKFTGTAGVTYRIEHSPTLGSWTDTGTGVAGTGAEQTVTLTGAGTNPKNFFRIVAPPPSIPGFVYLSAGSFRMGDQSAVPRDGNSNELPVSEVPVGGFYLKTTEVTKAEWDTVRTYADSHGYTFSNAGQGKSDNHPVHTVNWYDAVKWCNAKSEQDGLEPCYYVTSGGALYKTGSPNAVTWSFTKNGYRLPAESEWEKAARGGLVGNRFPWGETITHARANYQSLATIAYDVSATRSFHPDYATAGTLPYTAPVGSFAANGFGLYDMTGNVREFCWDSITTDYSNGYIIRADSSTSLIRRVVRGGDWSAAASNGRCSFRGTEFPDTGKGNHIGFRLARGRLN